MESLKIFDDFKFGNLSEDWIKSIWDMEFIIYNEPPDEYLMFLESEDMRLLLHEACAVVKKWLAESRDQKDSEQNSCSEISWNTLILMDVKVRALLAVLGYVMKSGQGVESDEDSKQSCLSATNLYFVLLAVPGSSAFNVFHPNLYQRAVETLRVNSERLQPPSKKRGKAMNIDIFNMCEESANDIILSAGEKEALVKHLNATVCNLILMTKSFWFRDYVQSLDTTIHGLLDITRIENECMDFPSYNRQKGTLDVSLLHNAYTALRELCDSRHGPVKVTVTFIAKYALPRLLCSHTDTQTKFIANIRESTIHFLKELLDTHDKEAESAVTTLIQQLMLKCPDRCDARQKQAGILIKLFGICKQNIILEAFQNLILLSHHCKIPFRLFAQEIIGKVLIDFLSTNCDLAGSLKVKTKKLFFAVVLSRCMDCSSMVRGKAMAIIAELTESDDEISKMMFSSIFNESDPNKKFLTLDDLKKALSEDVDLLPGLNALITMLKGQIEDDRATIRRSTLQTFKNLVLMLPILMDEVIPLISRRCRDPTLTVRRFAVQVLSQLLEQFPKDSQLLDEWVQNVVPLIYDMEVKVQEKVLEYLQELLLNRIIGVSTSIDDLENHLPWKILNTLINMKMRKHLSKACNLWVQNGAINDSALKSIQSYIGTNNDVGAWVFLAALAENTKLPNMNKYILNYKEIFEENDFHASLVLHVLRCSWSSLDHEVLESIRVYLYECLQQFKINFGLISICLDIIHNIIKHVHRDENTSSLKSNILNLIQISETEITKILKNDHQILEAAPKYLRAMFTLGHATLLCRRKISPLTLRILQGILLERETLPEVVREIKELQASAVVILGQQAMRDREIAKEVVPIFGRLMKQETNLISSIQVAVKINAAKALADICIRFTALVEPYLSDMCVSMKDSNPQVREAIMVIFIQLLLEDFIKVKGPFFFHILTMLSDSDNTIRELTIFLIEERLLTKNKTLISQQFLQSMYHYNNYQSQHKVYQQRMRENERKALTLPGKRNEEKRRMIYDFMLDHLDPPGKIKLLVKITSQLLGGACVNLINVTKEEGACILKDALYVISNDRLRPSTFNKHGDDDQQENEEPAVQTPATNAVTIIIEGMKKHGIEVLLPVLIKLKIKLSRSKSPLENDAKRVLVKTYSEYNKDQLSNILSEYPKLEKEVEQFRRQMGDLTINKDDSDEEEESNKHDRSINNSDFPAFNAQPKLMLRRVSFTETTNWKTTSTNLNLSLLSPSSLDSWNPLTGTPILPIHSTPQPGPSTSTPKTSRNLDFDSNGHADCFSKGKRLSTIFQNTKKSNNFERKMRKRTVSEIEGHVNKSD